MRLPVWALGFANLPLGLYLLGVLTEGGFGLERDGAKAARSVFAIHHDEIERPSAPQLRQLVQQGRPSGPPDDVAYEKKPHLIPPGSR